LVSDLFEIAQGIQTGNLQAFLLKKDEYEKLPKSERKYFRKALMTDSIREGRIVRTYYLFFPHNVKGPIFSTESAVSKALPAFYRKHLKPNAEALKDRASIRQSGRRDWWGLMRPRKFSFDRGPRIISKFFGDEGSFVLDLDAEYLAATGHVWLPRKALTSHVGSGKLGNPHIDENTELAMRAYSVILNSRFFMSLVSMNSVAVAGGQFDLSSRFLKDVHLPNLWDVDRDTNIKHIVRQLALLTDVKADRSSISTPDIEALVAALYGVSYYASSF
jgi:adenine-specific DNA-methyltransferase